MSTTERLSIFLNPFVSAFDISQIQWTYLMHWEATCEAVFAEESRRHSALRVCKLNTMHVSVGESNKMWLWNTVQVDVLTKTMQQGKHWSFDTNKVLRWSRIHLQAMLNTLIERDNWGIRELLVNRTLTYLNEVMKDKYDKNHVVPLFVKLRRPISLSWRPFGSYLIMMARAHFTSKQ